MNSGYVDKIKNDFDKSYAEKTDFWTRDCTSYIAFANIAPLVADAIDPLVLDIGAGNGFADIVLTPFCSRIDAIDISKASQWDVVARHIEKINFIQADFLNFKTNTKYSFVIDNGCFHHQHPDDYNNYLSKVESILTNDGVFSLLVFENSDPDTSDLQIVNEVRYCKEFTLDEITKTLESHSFQIVDVHRIDRNKNVSVIQLVARKLVCDE